MMVVQDRKGPEKAEAGTAQPEEGAGHTETHKTGRDKSGQTTHIHSDSGQT